MRDEIRAAVPASALVLHESPAFHPTLLHSDRCCWTGANYDGGLKVETINGNCTSGWWFFNSVYGNFGTTAGHCGHQGDTVSDGSHTYVNTIAASTYYASNPTQADTATFPIGVASGRVAQITTGTNQHRAVCCAFGSAAISQGTSLCFQGISSGNNNCGTVNTGRIDGGFGGVTVHNVQCINHAVIAGDSGGPIYNVQTDGSAKAAGGMSQGATVNGTSSGCFDSIYYATTSVGSSLVTR